MRIVQPPAAMIDWPMFQAAVHRTWETQYAFNKRLGFGGSTRNATWHGKPIGLVPFLRVCKAMGSSPLTFLIER